MNYIFNAEKIINMNTILNINNINKKILNYNEVIELIKYHFSSKNMVTYFGNMADLNGIETHRLYKNLLDYFLNLFLKKMYMLTNINIMKISDDNDSYICFIALCMNIIRGGEH